MTDHAKDIEALLDLLAAQSRFGFHSALTALVAERDALKQRIAELEAQPPAASDLRERLVCAALTGLCGDHSFDLDESVSLVAVAIADRTLAAMRKGDTNGK